MSSHGSRVWEINFLCSSCTLRALEFGLIPTTRIVDRRGGWWAPVVCSGMLNLVAVRLMVHVSANKKRLTAGCASLRGGVIDS